MITIKRGKIMVYLRTIISSLNEIKYIKIQLEESYGYVDKIIVCEFDHTHTGIPRSFIFSKILEGDYFSEEEKSRILYIKGEVGEIVKNGLQDSISAHSNEQLFRGYFVKRVKLKMSDIIIAVDADEIIFRRSYPFILKHFTWFNWKAEYRLKLYQFMYKPSYIWEEVIFTSSVACRVRCYKNKFPAQWRDRGKILKPVLGCHFSWFLTVDEMKIKLKNYAHAKDYENLDDSQILEEAVNNKKYPFDPQREFTIKEVNLESNPEYYPDSFSKYKEMFEYLE